MKEYIVSQEYIDGIYTDEGSTFGLDMLEELIRCKDCKHYSDHNEMGQRHYCWYLCEDVDAEKDYCSWAERKEE